MIKVAKFEKVTFEQYQKDIKDIIGDEYPVEQIKKIYERIQLPAGLIFILCLYYWFNKYTYALEEFLIHRMYLSVNFKKDTYTVHVFFTVPMF